MKRWIATGVVCVIVCITGRAQAGEERWVLASASNPGQAGTRWTTDVWVYSPVADAPIEVSIAFLPEVEGTVDPGEVTINVPAVTAVEIRDVVGELFGESRPGALRFRSEHPFEVRSRTFNGGGEGGTFGQGIPGLKPDEQLKGAVLVGAANIPGPDGVRTNVGIVNPGESVGTVWVSIFDNETQQVIGDLQQVDLGPGGWFQANAFELVGAPDLALENAVVRVASFDGAYSYISRIDNRSGDATFVLPIDDEAQYTIPVEWEILIGVSYSQGLPVSSIVYTGSDGEDVRVDSPETPWFTPVSMMSPAEFCYTVHGSGTGSIQVEVVTQRGEEPQAISRRVEGGSGLITVEECFELY